MKKLLRTSISAIVFSNLFISISAVSLYFTISLLVPFTPLWTEALLVGSSCFFVYNLLKFLGISNTNVESLFSTWMRKRMTILIVLMFASALVVFYLLFTISLLQWLVLTFAFAITLLYVSSQRNIWYFKTPIVALVWSLLLVAFPCVRIPWSPVFLNQAVLTFFAIYFFIEGLTIPFEIRDSKLDSGVNGITTLYTRFGIAAVKKQAVAHLLVAQILFLLINVNTIFYLPVFALAVYTICRLNEASHELQYTFVLDGLIILLFPISLLVL